MSKSRIIIEDAGCADRLAPIHPGEILLEEFLKPLGLSQYRIARDLAVPPRRINEIVHGTRAITADTALRLARYFSMTPQFWLNLQTHYDLEVAKDAASERIEREVPLTLADLRPQP